MNTKNKSFNTNEFLNRNQLSQFIDPKQAEKMAQGIYHKMQTEGLSLKEAAGLSDELLEQVYCLAYAHYNQGKFNEAIPLFEFLAHSDPTHYKYTLGLAAAYYQIKSYEAATVTFYIALAIEPNNPIPGYHVIDCFLKQELHREAYDLIDSVIDLCGDHEKYSKLKERCHLIKQSLEENLKEKTEK